MIGYRRTYDVGELHLLRKKYSEGITHSERQRGHLILLYKKGFSIELLNNTLGISKEDILILIKAWYYFGEEMLFNDDLNFIKQKVLNKERPKIIEEKKERTSFRQWSIGVIKWLFIPFGFFFKIILEFINKFISSISNIDYKKYYSKLVEKKNVNYVKIKRGSNNVVFQINLSVEGIKESKEIIANTFAETKKQINEIFNKSSEGVVINDKLVALTLSLSKEVEKLRDTRFKREAIIAILTFTSVYVWFNVQVKTGVIAITFFASLGGATIINMRNNDEIKLQKNGPITNNAPISNEVSAGKDSVYNNGILRDKDSVIVKKPLKPTYLAKDECINLTELGIEQLKFINQDTTDYYSKQYYVSDYDGRYYLSVCAYEDIKKAAFQRSYLIKNQIKQSKILKIKVKEKVFYGVTIQDFSYSQVGSICEENSFWDKVCSSTPVQLNYNGNKP
jgi:hypothetical protein